MGPGREIGVIAGETELARLSIRAPEAAQRAEPRRPSWAVLCAQRTFPRQQLAGAGASGMDIKGTDMSIPRPANRHGITDGMISGPHPKTEVSRETLSEVAWSWRVYGKSPREVVLTGRVNGEVALRSRLVAARVRYVAPGSHQVAAREWAGRSQKS
jgi:hypothetical protein